tara:strand:+ start:7160 stop:7918 length:759 start_codon:yes stop_codon:yes gene_type:complete
MMQAAGVPPTGQVAIGVAQRGVLQNPGGATGNLGGAAVAARNFGRDLFRKNVARQVQGGQQVQGGTPTNNNPVATQLLLAPTFTPIQANAILDQTNMRIAIPVRQVDGEYILTMQKMEGVQAVQPAQGQGQQPTESLTPTPEGARPAESNTPTAAEGQRPATESSTPEAGNSTASATEPAKKVEGRQESNTDKYGQVKAPQGSVIMTMKMIDDMVNAVQWAGQAPITQMMSEYVKAQTGQDIQAINGTEGAA